jgi:hypothetical protein
MVAVNKVGPFRADQLILQLNRFEDEVRTELVRLRSALGRPWNPVRPGQQQSSYVARPWDAVWRNCYASAFTVELPSPNLAKGSTIFCQRLGAVGQTMTLRPSTGLIDGSATKSLTTDRDWALCFCDGEGWVTAE